RITISMLRAPRSGTRPNPASHRVSGGQQYVGNCEDMPTERIRLPRASTSRPPISGARSGVIRSRDLEARGTTRVALRRLLQQGSLLRLGRGIYARADFSPTEHHGLAVASAQVPSAVVCLLSALQFHGLTTQAP